MTEYPKQIGYRLDLEAISHVGYSEIAQKLHEKISDLSNCHEQGMNDNTQNCILVGNTVIFSFQCLYRKYIDSTNASFMINISSRNRNKLQRSLDNEYFIETEAMQHSSISTNTSNNNNNSNNKNNINTINHNIQMTDESIMTEIQTRKTKSPKKKNGANYYSNNNNFNSNLFGKGYGSSSSGNNSRRRSRTSIGGILSRFSGNSHTILENDYKSYINQHFEDLVAHMDPSGKLSQDSIDRSIDWLVLTLMTDMERAVQEISSLMQDSFFRFRHHNIEVLHKMTNNKASKLTVSDGSMLS